MEARGAVNEYSAYKDALGSAPPFFTVNLANGVTPFFSTFLDRQYHSRQYFLSRVPKVTVTHAWYRPTRAEFDTLHSSVQDHVLNGGLLKGTLLDAIGRQLPDDPVRTDWEYEAFQAWAESVYGRRLLRHPQGGAGS